MILKAFVLVGTIVSHDDTLSTIEFNLNPALNGGPATAVMLNSSIPCEISVGKKIYLVKEEKMEYPEIVCELDTE